MLRPGDVVLLKGSNRKDHLYRIIMARSDKIQCWRDSCAKDTFCNKCRYQSRPSGPVIAELKMVPALGQASAPKAGSTVAPGSAFVIGLGNPGENRVGTPHNIGQAVVDKLAEILKPTWVRDGAALIGHAQWKGRAVYLVKLQILVNDSGPPLRVLAEKFGFRPSHCILVHDDLDLPLGTVRCRMRGSSGGHKGVASILDVFQTDAFPRAKVGVGRPDKSAIATDYVIRPFSVTDRPVADKACHLAVERVLHLVSVVTEVPSGTQPHSTALSLTELVTSEAVVRAAPRSQTIHGTHRHT
jgi:aminoacyl-tRNA hydrolase